MEAGGMTVFGVLAVIVGLVVGVVLVVMIAVPVFRGIGWLIRQTFRFVVGEIGDAFERLDATAWRLPWTTRITFHWLQTFAPGVTVIEHSYRPIIGARFIMPEADGRITGSGGGDPKRDFCIDPPTERSIRELQVQKRRATPDDSLLNGYTLAYILQTARNWRGPFGTFHLMLTGGAIEGEFFGKRETRIVTLCTDLPLKRTGPLRFEATVRDYVPKDDLRALFITE